MQNSKGCVKIQDFGENLITKILTILSINFTFFKLETQNLNVRSSTKTVLRVSKQIDLTKKAFSNTHSFAKIAVPVTFLLYDLEC